MQNFTVALIANEFDVFAGTGDPIIASPFHITLDIPLANGVDRLVLEETDEIAPND